MLNPMPRKDVKLPPTPREAELMAEIDRLRWMLRSYEQLGGDAERCAAQWREENPIESKEQSE